MHNISQKHRSCCSGFVVLMFVFSVCIVDCPSRPHVLLLTMYLPSSSRCAARSVYVFFLPSRTKAKKPNKCRSDRPGVMQRAPGGGHVSPVPYLRRRPPPPPHMWYFLRVYPPIIHEFGTVSPASPFPVAPDPITYAAAWKPSMRENMCVQCAVSLPADKDEGNKN